MQAMANNQSTLTARQTRAVEFFVRNGCKNMYQALKYAGYSKAVCTQPQKVFSSPVVRQALADRGYRIIENEPSQEVYSETTTPTPKIDIENIPQSQIIELKRQLAELPDEKPKQTEARPSFVPVEGNVEGYFDITKHHTQNTGRVEYNNYSSL